MGEKTMRVVVAGMGLIGKRHVAAIDQLDDMEIAAIADPCRKAQDFARKRNIPSCDDLAKAIAEYRPDGVILSTPTSLHVEQGLACVAEGIPALIEKPLAVTSDEARVLVDEAASKNVPLLVGHHRRHNPLIQKAHQVINDGAIGQIRVAHVTCWLYKPDSYFEVAAWRKKKGAGPISVNLAHDVDLIRYLCGEVVDVQAQAVRSLRGYENEDIAAAILTLDNGALVTITVSDSVSSPWSWELTASENPVYPETKQSCYLIGGSNGSLSVPDLQLWKSHAEPDWWKPIYSEKVTHETADPLVNQIKNFSAVIAGREPPLVSGEEGLKTLRVIEMIAKAAT